MAGLRMMLPVEMSDKASVGRENSDVGGVDCVDESRGGCKRQA